MYIARGTSSPRSSTESIRLFANQNLPASKVCLAVQFAFADGVDEKEKKRRKNREGNAFVLKGSSAAHCCGRQQLTVSIESHRLWLSNGSALEESRKYVN